jgi:hypothetical protein
MDLSQVAGAKRPAARRHFAPVVLPLATAAAALACLGPPRPASGALATLSGGGKPSRGATGGDAESNPVLRHLQLIVDPDGAQFGSTTVSYEPSDVSLQSVFQVPNYYVTGGYVGVMVGSQSAVQPLSDFFSHPAGPEFGIVQVQWSLVSSGSADYGTAPDGSSGYVDDGTFGTANPSDGGDNTFALQFLYKVPPSEASMYEVEEDGQTYPVYNYLTSTFGSNNTPDSYEGEDDAGDIYTFDSSDTEDATDDVTDVPEPAPAGLLGAAVLFLLARRGRR